MGLRCTSPQPLSSDFNLDDFCCEEESLNIWLKQKALKNQVGNASRTFVICLENTNRVVGYYSLHTGSIFPKLVNAKTRRNMPDPIPAIYLGRLAVDKKYTGQGLSTDLIVDIYCRVVRISKDAGFKVLAVNALNLGIVSYYKKFGFIQSKSEPLLLYKSLAEISKSYQAANID